MINDSLVDERITTLLLDYVKHDKSNQAVLIDGDWGSGKTYFIQEVFIKAYQEILTEENNLTNKSLVIETLSDSQGHLSRNTGKKPKSDIKDIYYVSLYGLNDVAQIEIAIYEKMVADYVPSQQPSYALKLLKLMGKTVIPVVSQFLGITITSALIKEIIGAIQPIKDLVIVFDDLERCNIELNSILGYINNLVEHCNVKAIILANEKEIWRAGFSVNIAEKYNVALNYLGALPAKMAGEIANKTSLNDVKNIQYHAEKIFSQDTGYEMIKEKLIGLRIEYQKPLSESYDSVLLKYIDDQATKDILKIHKDLVLAQFNEQQNNNIRILISVFASFQKINKLIQSVQIDNEDFLNEEKARMLNYLAFCLIKIKTGKTLEYWRDDNVFSRHEMYTDESNQKRFIYGYKFIKDFATHGYIDEDETIRGLQVYLHNSGEINRYNNFIANSALKALVNWRLLEDQEVNDYLQKLKDELESKAYQPTEYGQIVRVLAELEENGFEIEYKDYIRMIREAISNMELDNTTIASFYSYQGDSNVIKRYREEMKPVFEQIEKDKNKKKLDIYAYLNTCQWDEDYIQQCRNNKELFLEDKKFLALFDISEFKTHIHNATAKEVHYLLNAINEVYNFDNIDEWFKADVDNLKEMIAITNKFMDETKKNTLKANLKDLLKAMTDYLARLQ